MRIHIGVEEIRAIYIKNVKHLSAWWESLGVEELDDGEPAAVAGLAAVLAADGAPVGPRAVVCQYPLGNARRECLLGRHRPLRRALLAELAAQSLREPGPTCSAPPP